VAEHDFATPPLAVWPVTLEGDIVRLEPLSADHLAPLAAVGLDERLWRWIPWPIRTREDLAAYVQTALDGLAARTVLPFATVERSTGRVIGSTRFANISEADRRVEIGWTWVAVPWQRSAVNSEAKLLMLDHAFGTWHCHRVELKTDSLNDASRNALLGIGATFEGIFRNHMVTETGRLRHSAYYSITDEDWPDVRAGLVERIARIERKAHEGQDQCDPRGAGSPAV
jgi:RimJ/RimL family protein N-acetyltransferase